MIFNWDRSRIVAAQRGAEFKSFPSQLARALFRADGITGGWKVKKRRMKRKFKHKNKKSIQVDVDIKKKKKKRNEAGKKKGHTCMISEEDVPIAQYAVRREPPATRILTPMVGYCQDPAGLTAQQPLGAALKLRLIARNGGQRPLACMRQRSRVLCGGLGRQSGPTNAPCSSWSATTVWGQSDIVNYKSEVASSIRGDRDEPETPCSCTGAFSLSLFFSFLSFFFYRSMSLTLFSSSFLLLLLLLLLV